MADRYNVDMALLAMHAYNVGAENRHIVSLGRDLGEFEYLEPYFLSNGFSAAAFRGGADSSAADQIVVAIRGTNPDEFWNDASNGYLIGVGSSAYFSSQTASAITFYQNLVEERTSSDLYSSNIALTGHSLGGGLAGYVAGLYGQKAVIFDNMAYYGSLSNDFDLAVLSSGSALWNKLYPDGDVRTVDISSVESFATTGEFLSVNRAFSDDPFTNYLDSHVGLDDPITNNPFALHSMALQVNLQWADLYLEADAWKQAAPVIWSAYLGGSAFAEIEELEDMAGDGYTADTVAQEAIAYSAVESGEMPFGNTAVHAMFNDAVDLSTGLRQHSVAPVLDATKETLGRIVVEYAARLALGDVTHDQDQLARGGIIQLNPGGSTLSVDFAADRWTFAGVEHGSAFKQALIDDAVAASVGFGDFHMAMSKYLDLSGDATSSATELLGSVSFLTKAVPESIEVAGADLNLLFLQSSTESIMLTDGSGGARDRIIVGSNAADVVTGADAREVLLGGDGGDMLSGGSGSDVLFGGEANDDLAGDDGDDWIAGGAGSDVIWGGRRDSVAAGSDGQDTADYADLDNAVSIAFDGTASGHVLTVDDRLGGVDQLHSIEKVIGTYGRDTLKLTGIIAADTQLTIDANGGQNPNPRDTIDFSQSSNAIDLDLALSGLGSLRDKATGGTINLIGFHTSIIGSDHDDEISDLSTGYKQIVAGGGNDHVEVGDDGAFANGGFGDDVLIGGSGNDILYDCLGTNDLYGGRGSDYIVGSAGLLSGGDGHDKLVFSTNYFDDLHLSGGSGNDVFQSQEPAVGPEFAATSSFGFFPPFTPFGGTQFEFTYGDGHDVLVPNAGENREYRYSQISGIKLLDVSSNDIVLVWNARPDPHGSSEYSHIGDLAIVIKSTGDSILLRDITSTYYSYYGTPTIREGNSMYGRIGYMNIPTITLSDSIVYFEDGCIFNAEMYVGDTSIYDLAEADFMSGLKNSPPLAPTSGDDQITGSASDDDLDRKSVV